MFLEASILGIEQFNLIETTTVTFSHRKIEWLEDEISFWDGLFSWAMLVPRSVYLPFSSCVVATKRWHKGSTQLRDTGTNEGYETSTHPRSFIW